MHHKLHLIIFVFLAAIVGVKSNHAQTTIFVTRHADREAAEPDPPLTSQGQRQATALSDLLADAKITHIFTTEFQRTQQTAAPTAQHSHLSAVVIPQANFDGLLTRIRADARPGESILVVGHRATVPRIVKALSGQDIPPLGSGEYTRLMAVTLFPDGRASVVTLRNIVP